MRQERTGNKKTIACFFSFFLSGRLGWTATRTRERSLGRTRLGRSIWRTDQLFCSLYTIMGSFLLLFFFLVEFIYRGWPRL